MKPWHAIALAAAVSAAAGAAHGGTVELPPQVGGAYAVRVVSLKEARFSNSVRQQQDFSCGAAAVATLLTHHHAHPTSERAVLDGMLAHPDTDIDTVRQQGFSMLDMKRYLAAQGFEADGFEASLADLQAAEVPAIAVLQERGYHHFVVVQGVAQGRVLFADPAVGVRAMPTAAFEALRAHAILLVIGKPGGPAAFNLAAHWRSVPRAPVGERAMAGVDAASPWRAIHAF